VVEGLPPDGASCEVGASAEGSAPPVTESSTVGGDREVDDSLAKEGVEASLHESKFSR
jgi:hypothetical protein